MQENITLLPVCTELLPFLIFAIKNLSVAYLLQKEGELNKTWYIDRRPSEKVQSARNITLSQEINLLLWARFVETSYFPF